ncbi:MAG: hypothetical protein ACI8Z5_002349 [Lentimonas sp.]
MSEPIDKAAPQKFYRIVTVTPLDQMLLRNADAVEFDSSLSLANLEAVFGVTVASGETVLPDVKALAVTTFPCDLGLVVQLLLGSADWPVSRRPTSKGRLP